MIKSISIFLLLCLFSCSLSACNQLQQDRNATVIQEDGQYYLILDDQYVTPKTDMFLTSLSPAFEFDSLDTMLDAIWNDKLPEETLRQLGSANPGENKFFLFDPDELYQPYHPDGISNYTVFLYPTDPDYNEPDYAFEDIEMAESKNADHFSYFVIKILEKDFFEYSLPTLGSKSLLDRTYYVYDTEIDGHKYRVYEIWDDNEKLIGVTIYIARNSRYFLVRAGIKDERPTYEWLVQFDIIPYITN